MYYIAKKIVNWGEKKDYLSSENNDVIRYGLEVLMSQIITFLPLLIAGVYMKQLVDVCIIILVFGVLRCTCAGYHTKNLLSCFLLTNITLTLCLIVPSVITFHDIFFIIVLISFLYGKVMRSLENCREITLKQKINITVLILICGLSISNYMYSFYFINITSIQYATIIASCFQKTK